MDDDTTYIGENSVTQHEGKVLAEKVNAAIVDLVSSTALDSRDSHLSSPQCIIKQEVAFLSSPLRFSCFSVLVFSIFMSLLFFFWDSNVHSSFN